MPGHRALVVGNKNAVISCRESEDFRIPETSQAGCGRGSEVDLWNSSDEGGDNDLVEIRVRLKADWHQRASGNCLFAAANR